MGNTGRCRPAGAGKIARFTALLALLFTAITIALPARSQSFDARGIQKPTYIDVPWRVQAGDDPACARPDFDDSNWMLADPYKHLLEYFPEDHPGVLWYRIRVKVAPYQTGLALEESHLSHALALRSEDVRES